jgi:polyisoprenoid-binding protein YceI
MQSMVCEDLKDADYNAKLIGHLKSDDFFSVDQFKTATLKVSKAEIYQGKDKKAGYTHTISGELTIKGITQKVSFPAKVTLKGDRLEAVADIVIDRTLWNVRYGSGSFFDNLGDNMIYNDIEFKLNLIAATK